MACKKPIKSQVVTCKSCVKLFYHPGCVSKHKVYDKNREMVSCLGPYEKFIVESDILGKSTESVRVGTAPSSDGVAGASGAVGVRMAGASGAAGESGVVDFNREVDWLIKTVKELKNEQYVKRRSR